MDESGLYLMLILSSHCTFFCLYDVFHYIHYIQGYKEREIIFRSGGLGLRLQDNLYESWVCMDHYCGEPVFCRV
jgi:hypothetical protein